MGYIQVTLGPITQMCFFSGCVLYGDFKHLFQNPLKLKIILGLCNPGFLTREQDTGSYADGMGTCLRNPVSKANVKLQHLVPFIEKQGYIHM